MLNIANTPNFPQNSRTAATFKGVNGEVLESSIQRAVQQYKTTRNPQAGEKIIKHLEKMVQSSAHRFANESHPFEDLCQVGFTAIFRKIDEFDPNRKVKVSTFLQPFIFGDIAEYARVDNRINGISRESGRTINQLHTLAEKLNREATIEEISEAMHVKSKTITRRLHFKTVNYQEYLSQSGLTREEHLANNINVEKTVLDKVSAEQLLNLITKKDLRFPDRIKKYIAQDCDGQTHYEIADTEGVCHQNIQQLIKKGIRIIKQKVKQTGWDI